MIKGDLWKAMTLLFFLHRTSATSFHKSLLERSLNFFLFSLLKKKEKKRIKKKNCASFQRPLKKYKIICPLTPYLNYSKSFFQYIY